MQIIENIHYVSAEELQVGDIVINKSAIYKVIALRKNLEKHISVEVDCIIPIYEENKINVHHYEDSFHFKNDKFFVLRKE